MGLERPIELDLRWGLRAAHLKGAPKVGPTRAIKGGEGEALSGATLAAPQLEPPSLSLLLLLLRIKP